VSIHLHRKGTFGGNLTGDGKIIIKKYNRIWFIIAPKAFVGIVHSSISDGMMSTIQTRLSRAQF